jgi:hypothetical protein
MSRIRSDDRARSGNLAANAEPGNILTTETQTEP